MFSKGGNILMNVGPTSAGIIAPIFEERLTQLGQWLGVNGEAIYKSRPWTAQNDTVTPGIWLVLLFIIYRFYIFQNAYYFIVLSYKTNAFSM